MSIPPFILDIEGFEEGMWIDQHDRMKENYENAFDQQNQIDWWRKNVEIRCAFQSVEGEIRNLSKYKKKVPKRLVSWTRLAELAHCNRGTLLHPKRQIWTKERFDFLRHLIENSNQSKDNGHSLDDQERLQIQWTEQLHKARNETSKWMGRFKVLEEENKALNRLLKLKENQILVNERKIKELKERIQIHTGEVVYSSK
jgi:hypothetical protein